MFNLLTLIAPLGGLSRWNSSFRQTFSEFFQTFNSINIDDIKFDETNYFGVQIRNTRLKMKDVQVACVCIILNEHTKIKSVSQGEKQTRKKSFWVKQWLENWRQISAFWNIFASYGQ